MKLDHEQVAGRLAGPNRRILRRLLNSLGLFLAITPYRDLRLRQRLCEVFRSYSQ